MRRSVFGKGSSSDVSLVSPGLAGFQVWLMVVSVFSFGYILGMSEVVGAFKSGDVAYVDDAKYIKGINGLWHSEDGPNLNDKEIEYWTEYYYDWTEEDPSEYEKRIGNNDGAQNTFVEDSVEDPSLKTHNNAPSENPPGGPGRGNSGGYDSAVSEFFKLNKGSGMSSLATGAQWAFTIYGLGVMAGGMFGMTSENSEALGLALGAGAGVYQALNTYAGGSGTGVFGAEGAIGGNAGWIGLGVAAIIFVAMYKDEEVKYAEFNCMPWQAPNGGDSCEVCNEDGLPCSEYRCKSLGQSCEIVNPGTDEEKCVYVNPKDVSPPIIKPDPEKLTIGYKYANVKASPPGPGFDIVNGESRDGCLKAFTSIDFGITTGDKDEGEPSQCKIDFNHTTSFDDMVAYVGGSNLYSYDHSETFYLPGAKDLKEGGFVLENGKDMTFYLRCKDKNGNVNEAEYAVNFCIDPTPDATAPKIEATSIANGGCIAENKDKAEVTFYVNEPSSCKWSFQNQDYDLMENDMSCSGSPTQINTMQAFGCKADLTGVPKDGANYYVRCKDQPGKSENDRNANRESFEFSLRGSSGLAIRNINPNGTVFGGVSPAPIELYVETLFGCDEGVAICQWSSDGVNYIPFFDTNNVDGIHTQRLDLVDGNHEYYVRCVDAGGNLIEEVTGFEVDIDTSAPVIARVYEEGGMLKVVTVRDSDCSYSLEDCDFSYSEGTEMPNAGTPVHIAEWNEGNTYYVKCRDEFLNEGPDCSVVVRPTENFL